MIRVDGRCQITQELPEPGKTMEGWWRFGQQRPQGQSPELLLERRIGEAEQGSPALHIGEVIEIGQDRCRVTGAQALHQVLEITRRKSSHMGI